MFERTVLSNGLRLLVTPMPHTHSVSIGIFIGTGSRYESDAMPACRISSSTCCSRAPRTGLRRWPWRKPSKASAASSMPERAGK